MAILGVRKSGTGRRCCRAIAAAGLACAVVATLASSASAASGSRAPAQRVGQAPHAIAGHVVGSLASSTVLHVDVALAPRNPGALAAFATAVSTPGNRLYRHYLARGQFAPRFGPTAAAIAAVERQLRSAGLEPGAISSNHLLIPVTAKATTFARAFRTGFHTYRMAGARIAYANTVAPYLGSATRFVQNVVGLDDLTRLKPLDLERLAATGTRRPSVTDVSGPQPCSAASGAAISQGGYTSNEIASAYSFTSLYNAGDLGQGQTVAVFELEPNFPTDITAFQACYGTSASVSYIPEDGGPQGSAGGPNENGVETELDIDNVIGLAPDATVDVYQAPNSGPGLLDNYTAMVDTDAAKVISTSWGLCESEAGSATISEEGTIFQQAATQGQSVFAAAGDDGSTDCQNSTLAVDDPGSQPFVTSVGGTSTTTDTAPPAQTVWNQSGTEAGAGGGGISLSHAMPTYQSGAPAGLNVINSHSSGTPCGASPGTYCREVPDVSADADPYTGYIIYYDGEWGDIGGTSGAAPLWAALAALTNASSTCAGRPIGFANPTLYKAAAGTPSAFFDVTSGNNDYTPDGYSNGLFPATTGYDMASGLGTPNVATLPATLCADTVFNTITVINPGTQTSTVGTAVDLAITALDSASGQTLKYSATGLPAGLSISSNGVISGTPTTQSSQTTKVTATDTTSVSGSATFTWNVNAPAVQCTPGYYSATGDTPCTAAPAGSYVSSSGARSATLCPEGTYNPYTAQTSCLNATPGTYVGTTGATAPTNCAAGSYSASYAATACALADPGDYVANPGSSSETKCVAGSFSPFSGATACELADPGDFVANPGSSSETQCVAGSFSASSGATACTLADPGDFVANPGSSSETQCVAGSFSASSGAVQCALADPGDFVANPGSSSEAQCVAGSFSASSGATSCTLAAPGHFVASAGSSSEAACAAGSFSASSGAVSCTLASPGSYVASTGATGQTKCAAGSFSAKSGATACTLASPGSYVASTGATVQAACAVGSFSAVAGASACTLAPPGSYVSTTGATAATKCALGTYNPAAGASECLLAPLDTYVASVGATSATQCPTRTFTLQTGSTSKAACVAIAITTVTLPAGTLYSSSKVKYSAKLTVKGGTAPYKWVLTSGSKLPPGLSLDKSTGKISGKATKVGTYTFTVKVTDTKTSKHGTVTAHRTFSIVISK